MYVKMHHAITYLLLAVSDRKRSGAVIAHVCTTTKREQKAEENYYLLLLLFSIHAILLGIYKYLVYMCEK